MVNYEGAFVFGLPEEPKNNYVVVLDENKQPITVTKDRLWEFMGDAMHYIPEAEQGEQ